MDHCQKENVMHLTDQEIEKLSKFYQILKEPSRLRILNLLSKQELCVQHIGLELHMEQSAVSHQLKILREYDLVKSNREGKIIYYTLSDDHISMILQYGLEHLKEKKNEKKC